MIFISENQKFEIGVSTNHKISQNHSKVEFAEGEFTLAEIKRLIEDNCFIYPLVEKEAYKGKLTHKVVNATFFKSTNLIPFDIDYDIGTGLTFEEFLNSIPKERRPTIAFKTRSYDAYKQIYHYRLLYLFATPIIGRLNYYTMYETIRKYLISCISKVYCCDDFDKTIGTDGFAYGKEIETNKWKGHCCKPIRTNCKGDIVITKHLFKQSDFELDKTFVENPKLLIPNAKIGNEKRNWVSDELLECIKAEDYDGIDKFPLLRDLSYTYSQFKNGYAIVRGNLKYAEFPRKFTYDKDLGKYVISFWENGDKRHQKLRMVGLICRFNDFIDNGKETISGDELFLSIFRESERFYLTQIYEENDNIKMDYILKVTNEVMSLGIETIITIVENYNKKLDKGKIDKKGKKRRRNVIRIDKSFWCDIYTNDDNQKKTIRLELRNAVKFICLLQHYDDRETEIDNVKRLTELKEKDATIPGCSSSQIVKFKKQCPLYLEELNKTATLEDLLFAAEGITFSSQFPSRYTLAKTMLEDAPKLKEKLDKIVNKTISFWKEVKVGRKPKPKNGRPSSDWHTILSAENAHMKVSEISRLLKNNGYGEVSVNSIKSWKYRVLKKLGE